MLLTIALGIVAILLVVSLLLLLCKPNDETFVSGHQKYKGLCLFDIDGTLTSGSHNEEVVDYCLNKGYAVGIATAGSVYTPSNIKDYSWMPKNLYKFMAERKFNTFNNVARGILTGNYNGAAYTRMLASKPSHVFWPGWFKGLALKRTGEKYGLSDNLILFDNDPKFLSAVKAYDHTLGAVCAGNPCNGSLDLITVKKALQDQELQV